MTKFTVIMPAYNEEPYVVEAVRSVLNQTDTDLELIAINDGSTDATGQLISSFLAEDGRVRLIDQGKIGKVAAFNLAFGQSSGDWVYFMGADDVMRPGALARWSALIGECDAGRKIAARARLQMTSEIAMYDGLTLPKGPRVRNFSGPLTLLSRGMMSVVAPIPEVLPNEDSWWTLCIENFADEILFSQDVVVSYRVHGGNSIARNSSFSEFSRKYHSRKQAVGYFLDRHGTSLGTEQLARLEGLIHLEEARVHGQIRDLVRCTNVSIKERARALAFAFPATYKIKLALDRWLLGH